MSEIKWFKVLTDMFADDKIKIIQSMPEGDALLVMWFKVLAQAGKTNDGGYIYLKKNIPYTAAMLSTLFGKHQQLVELALRTFSEFGMVDMDDRGYIFVTNWEKHQNIEGMDKVREQTRLRNVKYREKKRLELMQGDVNSDVTVTDGDGTDIDIEKEIKNIYGEHVALTDKEYQKLSKDIGTEELQYWIDTINDWFIQDTKRLKNYSDHNRMIRTWKRNADKKASSSTSTVGRTGKAAHHKPRDPELEYRRMEIARNQWIEAGNDPSEFIYRPN